MRKCKDGYEIMLMSKYDDGRYSVYEGGGGTYFFSLYSLDKLKQLIASHNTLPKSLELTLELQALGFVEEDGPGGS